MNLSEIDLDCLLMFWLSKRKYACDCRWTTKKIFNKDPLSKDSEIWKQKIEKWDKEYKYCDSKIRTIRKEIGKI